MSQDDARAIAFDPTAPAGERYDANAELGKAFRPLASELIPAENLRPIIDFINDGLAEAEMMKARGTVMDFPGRLRAPPARGMQSVYLDDLGIVAMGEYYDKPSVLDFDALRNMVDQTPILSSVVMTRIRQVSRFTAPSEDGGPGFEIRHVDRKHKLTAGETESCRLLGRFVNNCGWEMNPRKRLLLRRDSFAQFMAKSIRDSLSMDASPIETEMKRNRDLGIDGFYAVDGASIRLCSEDGYRGKDEIFAVQTIAGRLTTAYTREDLIYQVRNPRTDVRLGGYGLGEPELMIRIVTGFLNALTYNIKGFDENAIPKGLLHLSGNYSAEDLSSFKRYWNAMVKGVNNAWTLPVMVSSDQDSKASFEKFGVEFNEMYFAKFMTFLTSIICAIYGMDPTEINFESFAASKSSLSGDDTTEKLAASKDKGLRPLMAFYESVMTDFVIGAFDDRYCFRFVGLEDEDQKWIQQVKGQILSVDEQRAELGYERWSRVNTDGPDLGGAPLNPSLMGPWMQGMQGMQAQKGGDFGQPEGDDGKGPDMSAQPGQGVQGRPPGDGGQKAPGEGGEFGQPPAGEQEPPRPDKPPGGKQAAPDAGDDDGEDAAFSKAYRVWVVGTEQ